MDIKTIDQYIASCPEDVQALLAKIRETIHAAAPEATEKISYGMPTFYLNGNLVHFAAFKAHIGFYPGADGVAHFEEQLRPYPTSKGTIRFALGNPMPYELISTITAYRAQQNRQKKKK